MISDDLRRKTNGFAKEIQAVLNGTIASNVQVTVVASYLESSGDRVLTMGNRVSKTTRTAQRFRLRPRNPKAQLWMDVSFQLRMDSEREHLMVQKSFFGVFPAEDAKEGLCHYDYERDKPDGYPDAHVQVGGQSTVLSALNCPKEGDGGRSLSSLHFPVGGKRFRPCLEDVIEFLVIERLVQAREDYEKVLEASREKFRMNQLRAAIRRNPEVAREYLNKHEALRS
ncbi:hypothetical protein [Streptomyces sp. NPDC002845]